MTVPMAPQPRRWWLWWFVAATLAGLTLMLLATAGLRATLDVAQAEQRVERALEDLAGTGGLLSALQDAETGQRGYLLTLDPKYLEPYESGRAAVGERLAALRRLAGGDPARGASLAALEAAAGAKLAELARTIDLARSGNTAAALAVVRTDEGRTHMHEVRRLLTVLQAEEERLLALRRGEASTAERRATHTLYLSAAVALLATLAGLAATLALARRQRRAEQAALLAAGATRLAGSEARLRSVVETAADGILVADAAGRILSANPAALRIFGYGDEPGGLAGRALEVLMPEAEAVQHGTHLAAHRVTGRARAIGVPGRALLGRRRDGTEFPIELSVCSFEVDGERFFTGVVRDVSGRVEAEVALRASESRWRTLAEALPQFTWTLRPDGACDWLNQRWEAYTGTPMARHLGHGWMEVVHPEDRAPVADALAEALRTGSLLDLELRLRSADGVYRCFKKRAMPLRGSDGEILQWIGTSTDVTDVVAAREVLAREAEQLDRLAEERGRALAASEARLAQAARMEALGRLAGGIAHDFNNVLQAVQGGIALASRRLPPEAEATRRYLDLASEATGRGAAVTGRLLSFARRGELRSEAIAPGSLLEGLATLLRPVLGPNLSLRAEVTAGLPPLLADKAQLEAVLVNLANNARDAMPEGGALALSAEAVVVPGADGAPPHLAPGIYVRLSVADEGGGMPPEVLARVTEPFFTTKPRGQGTGLGLAMARGFAEQSGGGLSIESAPGHGTTVSVWLPRLPEGTEARQHGNEDAELGRVAAPSAGAAVLLAEDEPAVRAVIAAQLADHGYAVREAGDAVEALVLIDSGFRPDALVTDLTMPGALDGLDLVRELRAQLPRLPAVLVTGHTGDAAADKMEEAERGGPFALLRKPAAPEALLERLARVLGQGGLSGSVQRVG